MNCRNAIKNCRNAMKIGASLMFISSSEEVVVHSTKNSNDIDSSPRNFLNVQ